MIQGGVKRNALCWKRSILAVCCRGRASGPEVEVERRIAGRQRYVQENKQSGNDGAQRLQYRRAMTLTTLLQVGSRFCSQHGTVLSNK
jgi:hypothetical protein